MLIIFDRFSWKQQLIYTDDITAVIKTNNEKMKFSVINANFCVFIALVLNQEDKH